VAGQREALAAGGDRDGIPGGEPGQVGLGKIDENVSVLAGDVADRAGCLA
jgi:hypothetical protein